MKKRFLAALVTTTVFFLSACGGTNNNQGVSFTNLGFFQFLQDETFVCGTLPTGLTGFSLQLGRPSTTIPAIGLQNNLDGQFIRTTRVNLSYFIPGASLQPPSTSTALSTVMVPAVSAQGGGDGAAGAGGESFESSLPPGFGPVQQGNGCSQSVSQVDIVPASIRTWLNFNQGALPEPTFDMIVTTTVDGITSAGDVITTNRADVVITVVAESSPTVGTGGTGGGDGGATDTADATLTEEEVFAGLFKKGLNTMKKVTYISIASGFLLLAASLISGCGGSGSTTGDGNSDASGQFVAANGTVGTLTLEVTDETLPVSNTAGFKVTVRDVSGQPVRNVQVFCDTEDGLALIEPTTGFELTDANGVMSGRVGCEAPGSYTMFCQLASGVNLQSFETLICTGDIPAGFTGFTDGTGGGGQGGGAAVPSDGEAGGDGIDGVRVTRVDFIDDGSGTNTTTAIDTRQAVCDDDPDADDPCEDMFDTLAQFTIENQSNQAVDAVSYNYTVDSYTAPSIALNGQEIAANGGTATFTALFAEVISGVQTGTCTLGKRFTDDTSAIDSDAGFLNITFRIEVRNEDGDTATITVRGSASFGSFDNCS